jgi:hypothetical protein
LKQTWRQSILGRREVTVAIIAPAFASTSVTVRVGRYQIHLEAGGIAKMKELAANTVVRRDGSDTHAPCNTSDSFGSSSR